MVTVYDVNGGKHEVSEEDIIGCRDLNIQGGKIFLGGREEGFYILCHTFGPVAMVYASYLSEALDIACDKGKLSCFALDEHDMKDYHEDDREDLINYLGNNGAPHDISDLYVCIFKFDDERNAPVLERIKQANKEEKEFWEVNTCMPRL